MALFEFKLPDLGEGIAEGEVVAFHVSPGELVREHQDVLEVMTDKATVTVGAPKSGRIASLRAKIGERVRVGSVLLVIDTAELGAPLPHQVKRPVVAGGESSRIHGRELAASAVGELRENLVGAEFFQGVATVRTLLPEKPLATPATRKLARELGINLRSVKPTGPGGRVTKADVRGWAEAVKAPCDPREERRPFVGLRRQIAERLQRASQRCAQFTFVEEVDADALKATLERLRPVAERSGVRLTYLPLVIKAVTLALKKHPVVNSTLDENRNELVLKRYQHIGVATATDQGLLVPVIRDADTKSPLQLASEVQRLAAGARAGTLLAAELTGSTFTVTSLGRESGLLATPVLNYPEVGILGVHRVRERAVVREGKIAVGNVMTVSLTLDHRIVDGHQGAAFAYEVIKYLDQPELMLLELA